MTKKKNVRFKNGDNVRVVSTPTWGKKDLKHRSTHLKVGDELTIKHSYKDGDYDVNRDGKPAGVVHQRHLVLGPRIKGIRLHTAVVDEVNSFTNGDAFPAIGSFIHGLTETFKTPDAAQPSLVINSNGGVALHGPLRTSSLTQPKKWTWADVKAGDRVTAKTESKRVGVPGLETHTRTETVKRAGLDRKFSRGIDIGDLHWADLNLSLSRSFDSWEITRVDTTGRLAEALRPLYLRRKSQRISVKRIVEPAGAWMAYALHAYGKGVVEDGEVYFTSGDGSVGKRLSLKSTDIISVNYSTILPEDTILDGQKLTRMEYLEALTHTAT